MVENGTSLRHEAIIERIKEYSKDNILKRQIKETPIILEADPVPLQRHRHNSNGNTYNPQTQLISDLSFIIKSQWKDRPLIEGPVKIIIIFFMPIPKSYSQKKQKTYINKYHHFKPDCDNLTKMICECIMRAQCIVSDDSQISIIQASKVYSLKPRTEFIVQAIDYDFNETNFWNKK